MIQDNLYQMSFYSKGAILDSAVDRQ